MMGASTRNTATMMTSMGSMMGTCGDGKGQKQGDSPVLEKKETFFFFLR